MKNVKCKNCAIYVKEWCWSIIDSPDSELERDCEYFVQKTNYSKIKSMNADQLAKFLVENGWDCNNCSELQRMQDCTFEKYLFEKCDEDCVLHCKEWLSKEVNDDEDEHICSKEN
jgi:hypothetical protein